MFLILTGCNTNEKKVTDNKGESDHNSTEEKNLFVSELYPVIDDFKCEISVQEIKDINISTGLFITNDGKLYRWTYRMFQNQNQCKEIETPELFERFYRGGIISKNNEYYYYLSDSEGITKNSSGSTYDGNVNLYNKFNDIFWLYGGGNDFYARVEMNYIHIYGFNDKLLEKIEIPEGEEVIYFGNKVIKTNKNYYTYDIINSEDCRKYADVKCEYGLKRNKLASDNYDRIKVYVDGFYILKEENKIYSEDNFIGG